MHHRLRQKTVLAVQTLAHSDQKRVHLACRRKQSGVTRHPTHRVGVVIMHFAAENFFSPRAIFRRRDHLFDRLQTPRSKLSQIDKTG